MPNASIGNATKFQEKLIIPSRNSVFEVSMPRYTKTRFVKVGTFCGVGSQWSKGFTL